MATLINVNGSDDPSYRYKMPRLIGKIEGRGNGIKTVIVNCSDIAAALKRSPGQVCKFFGCELGAMTKYEDNIDRALVNGAFETKDLQEILTKYIAKFVLCSSCGNPETEMQIKGKKKAATIWLSCKACGATDEADNTHKLCTFILKEMGSDKGTTKKEERKKKKAEKQAALERGETVSGEGDSNSGSASDEKKKKKKKKKDSDEKERKRKKKEKKRKEKERGDRKMPEPEGDEANPEDNWSESSSDSEFEAPVASFSNLAVNDTPAIDSGIGSLTTFMQRNPTFKELIEEVQTVQVNCGLRASDRIPLLFFAVVCERSTEQIAKWVPALKGLVSSRSDQEEVLKSLEESVARAEQGVKQNAAKTVVPLVLKLLYDNDILEEDVILEWHSGKMSLKHERIAVPAEIVADVKNHALPIVQWLEEADEDDSGESEEEDD